MQRDEKIEVKKRLDYKELMLRMNLEDIFPSEINWSQKVKKKN